MGGVEHSARIQKKKECGDSTGCGEVDNYFATNVDKVIDIVYEETWMRIISFN